MSIRRGQILIIALFTLFGGSTSWAKDKLALGIYPYKPAAELYTSFKPVAQALSEKLGQPVDLVIGKSYEETVASLGSGEFDVAYLGPIPYIQAKAKMPVIPLAQVMNAGKASFKGVIVVKPGSPIKSMSDLKGKKFAFIGEKLSTGTSFLPLHMLMEAGLSLKDFADYAFLGGHENVAKYVLEGKFDAGMVMEDVAKKYSKDGLQIISASPDLPEHVFVATPAMNPSSVAAVQDAFLGLSPEAYKSIRPSLTGLQKFEDKDFDLLRGILKKVDETLKQ